MLNKKIIKVVIIFIILPLNLNCGFLKRDYYSIPVNKQDNTDFLLRGSGWIDSKYGYAVNNVNQYEDSDMIIAVRINNFYSSYWAFGPFYFTIIPAFGLIKEYAYEEDRKQYTRVTVAVFSKKKKSLDVKPCNIVLSMGEKKINPEKYYITYLYQVNKECECNISKKSDNYHFVQGNENDVLIIDLDFKTVFNPENSGRVIFSAVYDGDLKIKIPDFIFQPGSGFIWMSVL